MFGEGLSNEQAAQLIGGGECYIHTHPKEQLNFSDRLELMAAQPINTITGDYTLSRADELVLVDTSAATVTITVPLAENGREFQIVKYADQNALNIDATAPDKILASDRVIVYNRFTSLHLKAVPGGYIFI